MHTLMFTPEQIWQMLEQVADPEIPVLSVVDLGVVRHVAVTEGQGGTHAEVTITPTYSGCPAMDMIATAIRMELLFNGLHSVAVISSLSPAWTTDWMSDKGREKLKQYGIAPPVVKAANGSGAYPAEDEGIECPHCGSHKTRIISHFGSTACKALHRCLSCSEPFDYFKCH